MNSIFSLITQFLLYSMIARIQLVQNNRELVEDYYFIIITGGSAVIVVTRLAEEFNKTILLIEAEEYE